MTIGLINDIGHLKPLNVPLLGLDVGAKTIGIALSNQDIVTPLTTIKRTKLTLDAEKILKIIQDFSIGGIVIGYPLNMDGTSGPRAQSVRDFAAELDRFLKQKHDLNILIALADERLTTATARGVIADDLGLSNKKAKARGITDQLAAMDILECAIEKIRTGGKDKP